jgi:hypothetical protein
MSETGVALFVSSFSATLLALFGIDYYSLFWAGLGATAMLLYAKPTTRGKAALTVMVSTMLGAALGTALAEQLGGSRSVLIVCAIVCASGPQILISALLNRVVTEINRGAAPQAADSSNHTPGA